MEQPFLRYVPGAGWDFMRLRLMVGDAGSGTIGQNPDADFAMG
ncbi:hypothetical protein C7378_1080 [Acidipila rosea]|uniref:Uncharacterized protein n=1 Tax=Acidipila rosea TaxID=768535 RepID=A0A4R1L887_9BACT|nr:hypothetical protein C7378_1080 [Acidipila rosea]